MTKDIIKYLISYYQDFVSNITFEERQYKLEPNANYVFVGLRRAGKSYLCTSRYIVCWRKDIRWMKFCISTSRMTV